MIKADKYKTYSSTSCSRFRVYGRLRLLCSHRFLPHHVELRQPTDSRARDLSAVSFTLCHIICLVSMVERRHTRNVAADLEYHATLGRCTGGVWRLTLLCPSRWAASIRIGKSGDLNALLSAVGMSLNRDPHSCGIGKYGHDEQLVGLLSRLLH